MNKADYTALINAKLPDGAQLPSSDHRETMHTDPNSIIELIYGATYTDDEISQTYTSSTALFDYVADIYKVGNNVTITGGFTANTGLLSTSSIFEITDTDFTSVATIIFNAIARKGNSVDVMPVYIQDNHLRVGASILLGESYSFTINYKSLN